MQWDISSCHRTFKVVSYPLVKIICRITYSIYWNNFFNLCTFWIFFFDFGMWNLTSPIFILDSSKNIILLLPFKSIFILLCPVVLQWRKVFFFECRFVAEGMSFFLLKFYRWTFFIPCSLFFSFEFWYLPSLFSLSLSLLHKRASFEALFLRNRDL